jgi:hypothetical protein
MATTSNKTVIDFEDYEEPTWEEYTGDEPRPGWYDFVLDKVGYVNEEDETIRWIFTIDEEPYKGWAGMIFADMGNRKWLMQQVVYAITGQKKALSVDFENDKDVAALVKKALRVRGKVESRTFNDETRISLRKVRPIDGDAAKPAGRSSRAKAADVAPEPEPEPAAEENNEPYTKEELDAMSIEDLTAILGEDMGQDVPTKGRRESEDAYGGKLADLILAAQEAEAGDNADDFGEGEAAFEEPAADPEPEPEPAPARRRRGAAAAPAKAAAPAATTRRRRG